MQKDPPWKGGEFLYCVRRTVFCAVCFLTIGCGGSASRLIAELSNENPQVRRKAARALADDQYAGNERVVAALTTAIADNDLLVQEAAIASLAQFGADAKSAIADIEKSLGSTEPSIRLAAARAISQIDPSSAKYQQTVLESLRTGNGPLFLEIGRMGTKAEWAVPTLIELLGDQRTYVRALAVRTLGEIGIASDEVTSALQRRTKDAKPSVRRAVEMALERLVPSPGTPGEG